MATTIGGGTNEDGSLQNTIVIDDADLGKIDVVSLDNADRTELAVSGKIDGLQIGLLGDQDTVIAGRMITNAVFSNDATKARLPTLLFQTPKPKTSSSPLLVRVRPTWTFVRASSLRAAFPPPTPKQPTPSTSVPPQQ